MSLSSHNERKYYALKAQIIEASIPPVSLSPEGTDYLETLVEIADALGVDDLSFPSYATAISRLSDEELAARRSSLRMQLAEDELKAHLASLLHEETLIRYWKDRLQAECETEGSDHELERRKADLRTKAKEYQEELTELQAQMLEEPPLTVSELSELHKELRNKEKDLAQKRAKIAAFQGLPPNIELSRHELRNARDEQTKLIQLRERLLDRMASGVS